MSVYIGKGNSAVGNKNIVHFTKNQKPASELQGVSIPNDTYFHSDLNYLKVAKVFTFSTSFSATNVYPVSDLIQTVRYTTADGNLDKAKPFILLYKIHRYEEPFPEYVLHGIVSPISCLILTIDYKYYNYTINDVCSIDSTQILINTVLDYTSGTIYDNNTLAKYAPQSIVALQIDSQLLDIGSWRPAGSINISNLGFKIGTYDLFSYPYIAISSTTNAHATASYKVYKVNWSHITNQYVTETYYLHLIGNKPAGVRSFDLQNGLITYDGVVVTSPTNYLLEWGNTLYLDVPIANNDPRFSISSSSMSNTLTRINISGLSFPVEDTSARLWALIEFDLYNGFHIVISSMFKPGDIEQLLATGSATQERAGAQFDTNGLYFYIDGLYNRGTVWDMNNYVFASTEDWTTTHLTNVKAVFAVVYL